MPFTYILDGHWGQDILGYPYITPRHASDQRFCGSSKTFEGRAVKEFISVVAAPSTVGLDLYVVGYRLFVQDPAVQL